MCSLNAFTHSVHCRKIASTPNVETTATTTATGSPARPPPPPPPPPSPPDHQQRRRPRAAQAAVLGTYFEIRLSIYIFRTAKLCTRLARRGGLVLGVGGGGGLCVGLNQPNISMVSALPLCATQSVLFRPNPGTSTRRPTRSTRVPFFLCECRHRLSDTHTQAHTLTLRNISTARHFRWRG